MPCLFFRLYPTPQGAYTYVEIWGSDDGSSFARHGDVMFSNQAWGAVVALLHARLLPDGAYAVDVATPERPEL